MARHKKKHNRRRKKATKIVKEIRKQKAINKLPPMFKYMMSNIIVVVNDEDITDIIVSLNDEKTTLSLLLYRNHNQHRITKLFNYLKSMNIILKMLTIECLLIVNTRSCTSLTLSLNNKLLETDLNEIFKSHILLCSLINLLTECLKKSIVCDDCVRILLRKKLFAPLYTVLFALLARIINCLSKLVIYYDNKFTLLTSQIMVCI